MNVAWARQQQIGFTIVELLIVIVVIAILATISLVAYSGIQNRAHAAVAQSDSANAKKQLMLAQVDNGNFPTTTADLKASNGTTYELTVDNTASPQTFCLTTTNINISYKVTESSAPVAGSCPGHGSGGVPAITNLAANPSVEANLSGWGASDASGSVSSVGSDGSQAYAGSSSAKFTYSTIGTNSGYPRWLVGGTAPSQAIGTYVGSVMAKGPSGGYLQLCITGNSTGGTLACGSVVALSSTQWRQVSVSTSTTSVGNVYVYLRPVGSSGSTLTGVVGSYNVDAVMLQSGSTTSTYADGNSSNWVWNGAANNSTSTGPPL